MRVRLYMCIYIYIPYICGINFSMFGTRKSIILSMTKHKNQCVGVCARVCLVFSAVNDLNRVDVINDVIKQEHGVVKNKTTLSQVSQNSFKKRCKALFLNTPFCLFKGK